VTVSNLAGNRTTAGLKAAITIPSGLAPAVFQTGPTGWNTTGPTVSGQTVTYTRNAQIAGGAAASEVEFVITRFASDGNAVTVSLTSTGVSDVNKTVSVGLA
jgi:hypothetical protein